jgi:hypothetical protein
MSGALFPMGSTRCPTSTSSGGVAVNGFDVAVVKDTTFGPAEAAQFGPRSAPAAACSRPDDGGATLKTVVAKGGNAVDWWSGASGTWLAFGHGGAGDLVSVYGDRDGLTRRFPGRPLPARARASSARRECRSSSRSRPPRRSRRRHAFIGGGRNVDMAGDAGSVYRVRVTGSGNSVNFTDGTMLARARVSPDRWSRVRALASPAADSAASIADVPRRDRRDDRRRADPHRRRHGREPGRDVGHPGKRVNDVRAHCGSGTVWVGSDRTWAVRRPPPDPSTADRRSRRFR